MPESDRLAIRCEPLAEVATPGRIAVLNLATPAAPPVILEGGAATVWELVDGRRSAREIVAELADLEVTPEEVVATIQGLVDVNLVTWSGPEAAGA
ncbi:PqqD family protein [Nocardioides sp.]|uniref:PqqD family protein n=1 Tax=Nocardioides sp. TaxID=35761 RepID=UPI00356AB206